MATGEVSVRVDGRRIRLSNLDKVLYPATGTTKAEVIEYYSRIAPALIPHVAGRPVTRKRWPDGVGTADDPTEPFFAKQLEPGAPEWIPARDIEHKSGSKGYPLIEDSATLVHFAQVASLELHVPQWKFAPGGAAANPDRIVLDLDPGPGVTLDDCASVALLARDLLTGMGLAPFALTSGSKGIHLYAHLDGTLPSDAVSNVAHALAQALEADHPDRVTSSMSKARRDGKVFVDWSQNNGKKTTVAPYSLRGTTHPTVAAPRTWAELEAGGLEQLDFGAVLERFEADGDVLAPLDPTDGRLASYIAKRNAKRTPEPVPESPHAVPTAHQRFVIHEHHASRLHYDFRLEHDGVLVNWAVPKGLPDTSDKNHLAVQTEDHPIAYLTFSGDIPRGEYGAGRMWIWDTGTYEIQKWRKDEIIVTFRSDGPANDVHVVFVRTEGEGEKSLWLLRRMKHRADGSAQPAGELVVPHDRNDPLIARAGSGFVSPMLAVAATPGIAAAAATRNGAWVEVKWDGMRAIAVWRDGALRLFSRAGNELTERYPELTVRGAVDLGPHDVTLDGEIVALEHGRPSFSLLQNRMALSNPTEVAREMARTPVQFFAFDALVDGPDLAPLQLRERREHLERIASAAGRSITVPPVFDSVDDALAAAHALGLEGVMVKDPRSPYRAGERADTWLKVKLTQTQDVVIGGVRPGKGSRTATLASLLVGVFNDDGTLHYAGRVGSGFSESAAAKLLELLIPLGTHETPFDNVPASDASDAIWVTPTLVGEVEFAEWSPNGHLRHAVWRGLRHDVPIESVRRSS